MVIGIAAMYAYSHDIVLILCADFRKILARIYYLCMV